MTGWGGGPGPPPATRSGTGGRAPPAIRRGPARLFLVAAASVVAAVPGRGAAAQEPRPGPDPALQAGERSLRRSALEVARAWSADDAAGLASMLSPAGVRFQEIRGSRGLLDPRKAGAAVRKILAGHEGGGVELERTSLAGGTPARGFAELRWRTVPRGTSRPVTYTLFVGMVHGDAGWRVYEIRILP